MSAPAQDAVRAVLAEIGDIGFQVTAFEADSVVLRTTLPYDLHVRPAAFVYGRLRDFAWFDQVGFRRAGTDTWVDLEPLSLVSLALSRGEAVELRIDGPDRERLTEVTRAIRGCPLYRDYSSESRRPRLDTTPVEEAQFEQEFESDDSAFCLIKLNLENFVIGHLTDIETQVVRHSPQAIPSRDWVREQMRHLLFDVFENFGIISLDLPLDNLMQTRDMCYHLHFEQMQRSTKIPYGLMGIEWGQENGLAWRRTQACRHCYYFEQESDYYCDLFLMLVLRGRERVRHFVSRWRQRLDFSITLRNRLGDQLKMVEDEMAAFSPNFANPQEFHRHIRLLCELVANDLGRLTPYVELIRNERIYHHQGVDEPDEPFCAVPVGLA